jgi:hypothetical protein
MSYIFQSLSDKRAELITERNRLVQELNDVQLLSSKTKKRQKTIEMKISRLSLSIKKIDVELNSYDPHNYSYNFEEREVRLPMDRSADLFPLALIPIEKLPKNTWVTWPDSVADIKFGSVNDKENTDRVRVDGVGPGENRIAAIVGGLVMGPFVSYDIALPDSKWEVKSISSKVQTIRTCGAGRSAFSQARKRLSDIVGQLASVSEAVSRDSRVVSATESCRKFLKFHKEMIEKGEVSVDRFNKLQLMIEMYHHLIEEVPDMSLWLRDPVFSYPNSFFEMWTSTIKASKVFDETDGLIIVDEQKGFYIIPKKDLDTHVKLGRISLGTVIFWFADYNSTSIEFRNVMGLEKQSDVGIDL